MTERAPGPGFEEPLVVGIDIGGTKVLAGVLDESGGVLGTARTDTPPDADVAAVEDALDLVLGELAGARPVAAVGLAAAGFTDAAGSRIRFAPHLPWRDDDVRDRLQRRWGVPVALENDATAAGVAESRLGAGAGVASMLLVTVGTGIGGAVVLGGQVWRGASGMAGEFGHMQALPDGRPCPCGLQGCWEQYASGRALARAARAAGWQPGDRGDVALTEDARAGDPAALAAFDEVGTWLGTGLAGLVAAFDPALVVVGGGVSSAGELLLSPTRRALESHLVGGRYRSAPPVEVAALGAEAGLVGAGLLARDLLG